ncbi:hypothetical protein [Roseateles sp.]|uniref:hypothetical protein n=1 Tax=Roseateles sp. TaxID=1971397 RepID=UPI0039E999CD
MPQFHSELVELIDQIIINHGIQNPELLKNLLELRAQAVEFKGKKSKTAYMDITFKVAAIARFFNDLWEKFDP